SESDTKGVTNGMPDAKVRSDPSYYQPSGAQSSCLYQEPRNPTSVLRFAKHGPCPSSDPASAFGSRTVAHTGRSLTEDEGLDPHFSPARVARRGDLCRIRGLELNQRGNASDRVGGYGARYLLQPSSRRGPHGPPVL